MRIVSSILGSRMSFNYNKHKDGHGSDSFWTSYSDLFMGLSFVFLLLYVTASLRVGTSGIQQQLQIQKVTMENEDLKNQLKVYNTIKKDYLETEATQDDQAQYEELMKKLDLLQDQAKTEKERLQNEAQENARKEKALNKYQQMIRNIMNANLVAKSRIKKRDEIITQKEEEINVQGMKIEDLEVAIKEKKQQLMEGENKIANLNQALDKKMKEMKWAYKNQQITKKKFEAQMAEIQKETEQKVAELRENNKSVQQQLSEASQQLNLVSGQLSAKEKEAQDLEKKLVGAEETYRQQTAKLQGEFEAQRAKDRKAFEDQLNREKLSASQRAAREAAYRAEAAKKEREFENKIAGLKGQLSGAESQLAKVKAEMDARKDVAREIKKGFAKAGVKAEIDEETGDVTLDFGDHYFETGSANLKPQMEALLKKAMPIYSSSLLENKKIADKISNVEIIGFASPTYKGRFVDPSSLEAEDKKAAEYNLDLSYKRAKSIYQYVFDTEKMKFVHQKGLRPLVKVSGKSFFEMSNISKEEATKAGQGFCKKYDCKKAQRVLIKFTVDQK